MNSFATALKITLLEKPALTVLLFGHLVDLTLDRLWRVLQQRGTS